MACIYFKLQRNILLKLLTRKCQINRIKNDKLFIKASEISAPVSLLVYKTNVAATKFQSSTLRQYLIDFSIWFQMKLVLKNAKNFA